MANIRQAEAFSRNPQSAISADVGYLTNWIPPVTDVYPIYMIFRLVGIRPLTMGIQPVGYSAQKESPIKGGYLIHRIRHQLGIPH